MAGLSRRSGATALTLLAATAWTTGGGHAAAARDKPVTVLYATTWEKIHALVDGQSAPSRDVDVSYPYGPAYTYSPATSRDGTYLYSLWYGIEDDDEDEWPRDPRIRVVRTAAEKTSADIDPAMLPVALAAGADNKTVFVAGTDPGTQKSVLKAVDTVEKTVGDPVELPGTAAALTVSPDGKSVYVVTRGVPAEGQTAVPDQLSVLNVADSTLAAPVAVGESADAVAVSPDGKFVYTVNTADNSISVVDTGSREVTTLDWFDFYDPDGSEAYPLTVAADPTGDAVYVVGADEQENSRLWKINAARDGLDPVRTLTGCDNVPFEDGALEPQFLAVGGTYAYASCPNSESSTGGIARVNLGVPDASADTFLDVDNEVTGLAVSATPKAGPAPEKR